MKHSVTIVYCTQCHWLPRADWMAQELLHTFAAELEAVTLKPATGGAFEIGLDGQTVWERKRDGGFPDAAELKRRIRDRIDPGRDLGHIDAAKD